MELKDKLASIDTLIFNDPDILSIINAWSKSQGFENYAGFVVRVVESNTNDAITWARIKATNEMTWAELSSKV